jgi:NAD(P)-dependent dehydrogenase (short-subunit alcohol dehydrogenase family)
LGESRRLGVWSRLLRILKGDRVAPGDGVPLAELWSLKGRTAVITGGGRGIGRAVAHRVAEAGATVTVADVDLDVAEETAEQLRKSYSATCHAAQMDISDSDAVRELADTTAARDDRLDVWINTAAIWSATAVVDTPDDIWHRTIRVDLDGSFYCAREAARHMLSRGTPGVIVLFTSLSAHKGRIARSHYVAAKHGVKGLVRSLAVELGPSNIRVVGVAPSVTDTRAVRLDSQAGDQVDVEMHDRMMERAIKSMPMERMGSPDELARAVLFAASDMGSFLSGTTLHVDGGASAL